LDVNTIALNATHGTGDNALKQYDVHGLYGHMQSKTVNNILADPAAHEASNPYAGLRTFISTTSTFAGTGQYAQHHLSPMKRTWDDMRYSIAGIMNFNMFGIPFTGGDVCGSFAASTNQTEAEQ
jgi:alpha-glucosidase (family GH31 glycosyl hydrolase)